MQNPMHITQSCTKYFLSVHYILGLCLAVMCLIRRQWKKDGLYRISQMAGQSEKVLAKLMRSPGATVVSGGVPSLDRGPELELRLAWSLLQTWMGREDGRNVVQRSSRWSLHSILLLP